jgi:hypothetical protein
MALSCPAGWFLLVVSVSGSVVSGQDASKRSAAAIVAEFDGVSYPSMSGGSDPESLARFTKAIEDAAHRQEACALELLESHPGHARVPELLRMRWQLLVNVDRDYVKVRRETEPFVTKAKDARLVPLAHVARAWACVEDDELPTETRVADLEAALKIAPEDFLARVALLEFAQRKSCDPEFQRDVAKRIAGLDASHGADGDDARRLQKMLAHIGQPWPNEAADATEPPLALAALHGHPVVLSFFPSPYSDQEKDEAADLKALAKEFGGEGLEVVVVHTIFSQDDAADRKKHVASLALPGRSHLEVRDQGPAYLDRTLGADVPQLSCLLDRDSKLVALSFQAKSLRPALAKLGEAKGKRKPI